jgi:hypothetical protein
MCVGGQQGCLALSPAHAAACPHVHPAPSMQYGWHACQHPMKAGHCALRHTCCACMPPTTTVASLPQPSAATIAPGAAAAARPSRVPRMMMSPPASMRAVRGTSPTMHTLPPACRTAWQVGPGGGASMLIATSMLHRCDNGWLPSLGTICWEQSSSSPPDRAPVACAGTAREHPRVRV